MRVLHLIRHGPVVVDLAWPFSQWELSSGALEAITPLARAVRSAGFRRVVTSNQRRAVQTARVLGKQLGALVVRRHGLEEHHRLEEQRIDSAEAFHKTISEFSARSTVVVFGTKSASM